MTTTDRTWHDDADRRWADRFTLEAARLPAVRHADIIAWLDDVHAAVIDSGASAESLYGTPQEAAEQLVTGLPLERRAAVDSQGMTPRDAVDAVLMASGAGLVGLAIWQLITRGWTTHVSALGLLLVAFTVPFAVAGVTVARLLRRNGRLRPSAVTAAVTVVAVAAPTAVVLATVDASRTVVTLPVALIAALGVVLVVAGWVLPGTDPVIDDRSRSWTAEQWFDRLDGLLQGRCGHSRAEARSLVDDARAYSAAAGAAHPYDEFGAPETYATELTTGTSSPSR